MRLHTAHDGHLFVILQLLLNIRKCGVAYEACHFEIVWNVGYIRPGCTWVLAITQIQRDG